DDDVIRQRVDNLSLRLRADAAPPVRRHLAERIGPRILRLGRQDIERVVLRRQLRMPVDVAVVVRLATDTDSSVDQSALSPAAVHGKVEAVEVLLWSAEPQVFSIPDQVIDLPDLVRVDVEQPADLLTARRTQAGIGGRVDAELRVVAGCRE